MKLADFGSAAKLNKDGMVKEGPPVGTPDYIAPEVLQCLDNRSDNKSDGYGVCFRLECLLYIILNAFFFRFHVIFGRLEYLRMN